MCVCVLCVCVCVLLVCVCVCVINVIVKRPVLPACAVNGRSRNPLYYYYYAVLTAHLLNASVACSALPVELSSLLDNGDPGGPGVVAKLVVKRLPWDHLDFVALETKQHDYDIQIGPSTHAPSLASSKLRENRRFTEITGNSVFLLRESEVP